MGGGGSHISGKDVMGTMGETLSAVGPMLPFPLSLGVGLGGTAVNAIGKLIGDDPVAAQDAFRQIVAQNPQLAHQLQTLPPGPQQPPATDIVQAGTTSSNQSPGSTAQQSNLNGGLEALLGQLSAANQLRNLGPYTHAPTQQNQQIDNLLALLGQGQLTKPTMGQVPTTTQVAPNIPIANQLGKTQLTADVAEQHYVNPIPSAIVSDKAKEIGAINPLSTFANNLRANWFPQAGNTLKTLENQNQSTNIPKPVGPGITDTSNLSMSKPGTSTTLPIVPVNDARAVNQLNTITTPQTMDVAPAVNLLGNRQERPQTVGSILKETALDVANQGAKELGTMAGTYLKDNAGNIVKKGLSFLGKTIGGLFRGKLVGDAPLQPGTWAPGDYSHLPYIGEAFEAGGFGNKVLKMIGDAPADGVMNNEEAETAVKAMATSISITLFAKLVIIEQTLETNLPMIFSFSLKQAAAQTARQITVQNGMVRLSQLLFNTDVVGSYYFYDGMVGWYTIGEGEYVILETEYSTTYTGLVPVSDSPPLLGNVTYEALKPLLSGAPASEYPSTLRIKTRRTDIDALLTIASQGTYELTASSGYSFVLPLAKLLAYQSAAGQLPGDESTQFVSGTYPVINFGKDPFPLDPIFPWETGAPDLENENAWSWLKVAWVTYTEFADAVVGLRAPWQEPFLPIHWGHWCAIVFLSRSEMQDGGTLIVRMLSQIAFPYKIFSRQCRWMEATKTGFDEAWKDDFNCWPNLYNAAIEGPRDAVLFVVTDLPDRKAGFITLGVGGAEHVLTDETTPNDPWTNEHAGGHIHPIVPCIESVIQDYGRFMSLVSAEISRWESMYGNNSDRSSAMRWCAENCVRFGQPKNFAFTPTGALNIYTGYSYNANPNITPFGDLGKTFVEPTSTNRLTYARLLSTTPLFITSNYLDRAMKADHTNYLIFNVTHFLGQQDPVVEFMVERGMVSPAEEYPTVRFTLPPKNFSAISELAMLMAFTMDSSAQARSVTVKDYYSYPNNDLNPDDNQRIISRMALEKSLFPVGNALCSNGIQKPSFSVNYQSLEQAHYNPIYTNAVRAYIGDGITGNKNTTFGILGRVPWALAERWHPSFSVRDTNTNVYGLDVKITEHQGVNGYPAGDLISMLSCDYDVQFVLSLFRASKFLAGLMVSSLQVNNPLWLFDRSSNYFYLVAGATTPLDSVIGRIIALSEAVGVIQIPNFNITPLPICGFLPTYNIAGGGRKLRLAAIQPVDSFVNPGGSNDYQLFYPVRTQASLRTTIGYHEFGHPLFSDSTANNPFAY